jgi:hypothetical protein
MNVMDGLRNSQEMFVFGESKVNETSTELDYVVSGFQLLNLTIK